MTFDSLDELFVHKLRQQYYVETQLVETLDEMAINASNDRVSEGFADHRDETREQVTRLEECFDAIDVPPAPTEDAVFDGLEAERQKMEEELTDDEMLNMSYVTAGMMTERVEMTAYEGLLLIAKKLDYDDPVTNSLQANHDEEQSAYRELDAMTTDSEMKTLWDRITPS
ncbi:ferritin-like domain-containing protein [Natrialbaceae archaeon GCM10025810]|uniref:YciE/YciF ferroxidase family protein n=1 Tax=Halovalidus salilacus TaxID=3075124 RepID=UPI003623670D